MRHISCVTNHLADEQPYLGVGCMTSQPNLIKQLPGSTMKDTALGVVTANEATFKTIVIPTAESAWQTRFA